MPDEMQCDWVEDSDYVPGMTFAEIADLPRRCPYKAHSDSPFCLDHLMMLEHPKEKRGVREDSTGRHR